jgi:uncharacterized protein (TIGR00269 family)
MVFCTACKRHEAVYMRSYSGEKLCAKCFIDSIEDKVRATIAEYGMFRYDDKIMLAVSGGKDSITMLHILTKLVGKFPKSSLCAVTVDEGIKGYRDEALKLAAKSCRKLNVEHTITSFKELLGITLDELIKTLKKTRRNDRRGLSPCAYCGVLRRRALNIAAREAGVDKLATAHNLDDWTQTILLNILHGETLRIARVKPVSDERHPKLVQRVKPLCEIPEKEIAFYAYQGQTEFQSFPCPYAYTALRSDIRLILNRLEEKHAGIKYTLFRSIEKIRPALERLYVETKLRECKLCGEPTVSNVCKSCQILDTLDTIG